MMKKLQILFLILFAGTTCFAQYPLKEGQNQFNVGLGISNYGSPLVVGFDHGVHTDFSVGMTASFRNYRDNWDGNRYRHGIGGLAFNCNYHFNSLLDLPSESVDLYAGVSAVYYYWYSPKNYPGNRHSTLGVILQVGGRYYFNDRIGLHIELGGGSISGGSVGVSIKV